MFKRIMEPLLEAQNGLYCAVLADMEGELIARVGLESAESDAAALFAAHQGIIFTHMAAAGADMFRGGLLELRIRCKREEWFVFPVTTEYYLALAGVCGVCIGCLRPALRQCLKQLNREIHA